MERFRAALCQRIGLQFNDARLGHLGEVLQRRIDKYGRGSAAYLWELEYEPSPGEISALARELTVGETYFFRNHEQFEVLADVVLPERVRLNAANKTLRLLSAGCSSGEEPYSMAIVARETIADPSWKIAIRAVDVNPLALEKARCARYAAWALRETPKDIQNKWFRAEGRDMVLDEAVRGTVKFEAANLADDDLALWQPAAYDAIFCRNVLMYFEPQQMRGVIGRIARSLAPGGFLFLGHAETLRGVSDAFHLRNSHGTFYYQLDGGARRDSGQAVRAAPRLLSPDPPPSAASVAWFDAIRLASERVAALLPMAETITEAMAEASDQPAQPISQSFDPAPTFELVRQERFAEALDNLRAGAKAEAPNPDVLLLEAALLVHGGKLEAAADAAARLLLTGACSAGAHYVLALCREHAGLSERAGEHHREATRYDPSFAMPRLHLGLLSRRDGELDAACREFAQALVLLKREEPSRILLFGGGFSREALMALCESALKDCGAAT
jgi:chemotaxis protein methyltransferase CheR